MRDSFVSAVITESLNCILPKDFDVDWTAKYRRVVLGVHAEEGLTFKALSQD
jgi:hypothetical protein